MSGQSSESSSALLSLGGGESDLLVLVVEGSVVLPHEDVTEDPERSSRAGDVHAHDSEKAGGSGLDEVVLSGKGVLGTGNGEGKLRELSV